MKKYYVISCTFFTAKMLEKLIMFMRVNCYYLEAHGDFLIVDTHVPKEVLHEEIYLHMGLAETNAHIFISNTTEDEIADNFPYPLEYECVIPTLYGYEKHENVDKILDKISDFGMDFLTPFERDIIGYEDE